MDKARNQRSPHFPVREAKNRFSELVRRAAQGEQITITLHGEPRARLSRVMEGLRPFAVDWEWLREMKVAASKTPAEALIRAERDGRDCSMYLDSAILVKLVVREPDSFFCPEQTDGQTDVWSCQLALTESWSARFRKQRAGVIGGKTRRAAWQKLERYFTDGMLGLVAVDESILKRANRIISRCHPEIALRSLDAIHLASCEAADAFPLLYART